MYYDRVTVTSNSSKSTNSTEHYQKYNTVESTTVHYRTAVQCFIVGYNTVQYSSLKESSLEYNFHPCETPKWQAALVPHCCGGLQCTVYSVQCSMYSVQCTMINNTAKPYSLYWNLTTCTCLLNRLCPAPRPCLGAKGGVHCTLLYCTELYWTALYCTALNCNPLHCTAQYYIAVTCTAL